METQTLLLFSAAILPLVCTPGPDLLFVTSQAMSGGTGAGLRATAGVILGYCVHSTLAALGLAAVLAASPILFEVIRWVGITYLAFMAYKLIRAALRSGTITVPGSKAGDQLYKGFLTSLLNPKGMMMYVAVLPQFMDRQGDDATLQAIALSATFMFWCAVVYSAASIGFSRVAAGRLSEGRRRLIDGTAGGMILIAAGFIALAHR